MAPSPIGQKLLKMLGFVNHKNTPSGSKNVPINLYTNFYFHVEHKTGSDQDGEEEEEQSQDFQSIDFSRHRLTVENLKKVKRLRKSSSVGRPGSAVWTARPPPATASTTPVWT